jgi:hypothetical protein
VYAYNGVVVGLQLLCRDEFSSMYSGEVMYRWRNAEVKNIESTKSDSTEGTKSTKSTDTEGGGTNTQGRNTDTGTYTYIPLD